MKVAPTASQSEEQACIVVPQPQPQPQRKQPAEDVELSWQLYCGPQRADGCCRRCSCSCRVLCAQLKKDYREHNRVSILCHGVQYGVFCFVLAGLAGFFVWFASNVP